MRVKWILAGVVGTSAVAFGSPNASFQTILNNLDGVGDPISNTGGDTFASAQQVVVGDGGVVAVEGELETSGNDVIIFNSPVIAGRNNLGVIEDSSATPVAPTTVNGWGTNKANSSSQTFIGFNDVALTNNGTGTQLTFDAIEGPTSDGILQAQIKPAPPLVPAAAINDIAFDGDGQGYGISSVGGPADGAAFTEMQVNGSSQVFFPATNGGNLVLARGAASGVTTQFTSNPPTLSIQNNTGDRVALGADGSGAAILTASGTDAIYSIAANGLSQTKLSGTQSVASPADPDALLGYYSSGGNSGALFVTNGTQSGTQNVYLEKNNGTPQSVLSQQFTPSARPNSSVVEGEMTPNGQIALYIPDATNDPVNGDTIKYGTATGGSVATIASVAPASGPAPATAVAQDPSATNLLIESLQDPNSGPTWVPQVNAGGTIVFNALVGTAPVPGDDTVPAADKYALLDWAPGNTSPTILLAEGDQLTIGGQAATIDTLGIDGNYGIMPNDLSNENDYFRNALSDDGYLAVNVNYFLTDDPSSMGTAVLLTQLTSASVPEPTTLALLPIAGLSLLARRRRRNVL